MNIETRPDRHTPTLASASHSSRARLMTAALIVAAAPMSVIAQSANSPSIPRGHEVEVFVAEDAIQATYKMTMDVGSLEGNAVQGGFFLSEQRDFVLVGEMLVPVSDRARHPRWSLDVGPRAYGALLNAENEDVFALAIGGKLSYLFRQNGATTMSVSAFYAPDITTFGQADNATDVAVRFETQLTEAGRIFVGYRVFEFDLQDANRTIDDGAHVGFVRRF
jgi:hypothetical protein